MGFGYYPNRFLLDKMAEYGRGEVDYVSEMGDTEAVARRFHERIRNPLLTDLSVDWGSMPVSEVYPTNIPDLFSAKPVVLSGRYAAGGEGTIRLKGKMAGQEFVRDIPVKLLVGQAQGGRSHGPDFFHAGQNSTGATAGRSHAAWSEFQADDAVHIVRRD
jgi:hypothetical protein